MILETLDSIITYYKYLGITIDKIFLGDAEWRDLRATIIEDITMYPMPPTQITKGKVLYNNVSLELVNAPAGMVVVIDHGNTRG